MNSGPLLFLGLFATMACSWTGFVLAPQLQLGGLTQTNTVVVGDAPSQTYPLAQPGGASAGAEIYRANGCAACHTEMVRPLRLGSDIQRGWGERRSLAEDYLFQQPVMLGLQRIGPDLANFGRRSDINGIFLRLYDPGLITHGTVMPSYRFLFETRKIALFRSPESIVFPDRDAPPPGYELVPRPQARALAAYLLSLRQDSYLFRSAAAADAKNKRRPRRRQMNSGDPKDNVNQNGSEPVAGPSTVPIWLIVVFGGLFYWGQLFLSSHAGGFSQDVYIPYHSYDEVFAANPQNPEQKMQAEGRRVFEATCAACHQPNGLGKEGTAPPLAGSDWVLASRGDRIVRIVLNGLTGPITVKGQEWNLTMVPWRDNYSDEQIAGVLTYIRSHFDNKAGPIDPALVKAARAQSHPGPETSDELLKIPVQ